MSADSTPIHDALVCEHIDPRPLDEAEWDALRDELNAERDREWFSGGDE